MNNISATFRIKTSKQDIKKDGTTAIYLYLNINGLVKMIRTGNYIDPIYFDNNKGSVKKGNQDSISVNDLKLGLDAYKALRDANPHACFILVLQHTKDGQFRGGKDWEHKVEIGAEIYEPGKIRVFRNRYSVYGNYDFMKGAPVKEEKAVK